MDNSPKNSWFKKIRNKYRLVILNDDTLEERFAYRLSRLNLYILISTVLVVVVMLVMAVVVYTPLKEYIPGYGDTTIRRKVANAGKEVDSLQLVVAQQDAFISNIKLILSDSASLQQNLADTSIKNVSIADINTSKSADIAIENISAEELKLRQQVEQESNFLNANTTERSGLKSIDDLFLFTPVIGIVTDTYNADKGHFGVDVVASEGETIKSVGDGMVILASWTLETGQVIAVQHEGNLISIYKHNSVLLKKQGDVVAAGEAIAIIGGSGEESTGPHLHFELWADKVPVDPTAFINFE